MKPELLIVGNLAKDVVDNQDYYGGSAAIVGMNASRLDTNVSIVSVLGKDIFSRGYEEYLKQHRIDISLVSTPLTELPICEVISTENKIANHNWIDNDSHPALDQVKIDANELVKFNLVHLVSSPPVLASDIASKVPVYSYEPGPLILFLPHYFNPDLINNSTFLFFNEEEYLAALNISNSRDERDLIGSSNTTLVVTKGENGSDIFFTVNEEFAKIHIEAIKPSDGLVDPTGAGDCYKAGFLAGYLHGYPLEKFGMIGAYLGSAGVTQRGGILPNAVVNEAKARYFVSD